METTIFDGRSEAQKIKQALNEEARKLGLRPELAVIQVGRDPASTNYIKQKQKSCEELNFGFELYQLPETATFEEVKNKILALNADESIQGFILQLPLPASLVADKLIGLILNSKDIDGLGPKSLYIPPTAQAVLYVLEKNQIDLKRTKTVVLGKGKTAGAPIAKLLKENGADVFVADSRTPPDQLTHLLLTADLIVSCVGEPHLIKREMIKEGAVVIGVGMSKAIDNTQRPALSQNDLNTNHSTLNARPIGDLDEASLMGRASLITPTPGGIGPLTVAFLLQNLFSAAKKSYPTRFPSLV